MTAVTINITNNNGSNMASTNFVVSLLLLFSGFLVVVIVVVFVDVFVDSVDSVDSACEKVVLDNDCKINDKKMNVFIIIL